MAEQFVTHSTFVIERSYPQSPEKVFAALSDPGKKRRWFADGEESQTESFEMDFRVGGIERTVRKAKNGWVFTNDTVYRNIVPNTRVVFAYNMSLGEKCISSSLVTMELSPSETGTDFLFTEQAAFYEGADGQQIREDGWRLLLDNLVKVFSE